MHFGAIGHPPPQGGATLIKTPETITVVVNRGKVESYLEALDFREAKNTKKASDRFLCRQTPAKPLAQHRAQHFFVPSQL